MRGRDYAINDVPVTAPDEETWMPIVIGEALTALQRRSPYKRLEWIKHVGTDDRGNLDWWDYDNSGLTSITCTMYNNDKQSARYTDAVCQQVTMRIGRNAAIEIVATFLINVGA